MSDGSSFAQRQICQISGSGLIGGCQGAVYCAEVQYINTNGPAVKGVCVAERMKAGAENPNQRRVPIPAGMSEAWRGFWSHDTELWAYTSVAVQC
jgi:hypothetical protein